MNSKTFLTLIAASLLGVLIGVFANFAGGYSYKWIFAVTFGGCFILFIAVVGSLKKALQALLIFSLSVQVDFNPWWSDKYTEISPGIPITLTLLILLALYILWLFEAYRRVTSVDFFPIITIPFSIIVAWSGLSFLVAVKPSYVQAQFLVALEVFFLFLYAANLLKSKQDIDFVIKCLAVTISFTAILGIAQYLTGGSFNLQFLGGREAQFQTEYQSIALSRVSGFLGHPNNLAWFMDAWLPLLLLYAIGANRFSLRLLGLMSFALGFVSLILTHSRGGWLAFIFSLFLIFCFSIRQQLRKILHGLFSRILILSLVAAILALPFLPSIVTRLTEHDYGTAYSRIPLAQTALKIIGQNPLKGVGLGNYSFVVPDYDPDPILYPNSATPLPVHNAFLHTAAELGVPALLLFLWITFIFYKRGLLALWSPDTTVTLLGLGLLAGLTGFYLQGMVESDTILSVTFRPAWFMGGLLMGLARLVECKRYKLEDT